jgi:membrane-anchored protein YejM (alkaline phosphatase superfamily)
MIQKSFVLESLAATQNYVDKEVFSNINYELHLSKILLHLLYLNTH